MLVLFVSASLSIAIGLYRKNAIAIQKSLATLTGVKCSRGLRHNANYVQHSRIYA